MDKNNPQYIVVLGSNTKNDSQSDEEDEIIDENDFDFSDFKNKKAIDLGAYDPEYKHLTVAPGLNLKGKCSNINCRANFENKRSWVQKGFGEFDIGKHRFKNQCQLCNTVINAKTITTIGFTKCKLFVEGIFYKGIQEVQEVQYKKQLQQTEGKFIYFTDYDENIQRWGYLIITAKSFT